MRSLLGVISSLLSGVMLVLVNFTPASEVQKFVSHRRRFVYAILMGLGSVVLFAAVLLLSAIDLVIQYEHHAAVHWNGLLTLTLATFTVSLGLFLAAKALVPRVSEFVIRTSSEEIVAGFARIFSPLIASLNLTPSGGPIKPSEPSVRPSPPPSPARGPQELSH